MIGKKKAIGAERQSEERFDARRSIGGVLGQLRLVPWWPYCAPLFLAGVISTLIVLVLPANLVATRLFLHAAVIGAALWAALACIWTAKSFAEDDAAARRPWQVLGISLGCLAAGVLIQTLLSLLKRQAPTLPSPADLMWVAQYLLMFAALLGLGRLSLTRPERARFWLRTFIDTSIVAFSALVLTWIVLLDASHTTRLPMAARVLHWFYSVGGVALLFGALLLFFATRGRRQLTRVAGLMLLGVSAFAATSALHLMRAASTAVGTSPFADGTLADIGWLWASLFIGASAIAHGVAGSAEVLAPAPGQGSVQEETSLYEDTQREHRWQLYVVIWLPYIAALSVALLIIIGEARSGGEQSAQRLLPAHLLLLAIIARQMLTLWDNTKLSERLREANQSLAGINTDLEHSVRARTQHLATLHGITSTLNTSLDRRTVMRVALERTMVATGADGGGIWLQAAEDGASAKASEDKKLTWQLAHAHGFAEGDVLLQVLRDLAIAAAEESGAPLLSLDSQVVQENGVTLSPDNLILVPIRWGGALLGTFGLLRHHGAFNQDDRALAESVAMETGTALQNARLYQEARHRADRDSVTGLLNHRAMQERLNASLSLSRRHKVELATVMMDLNNFKFFNDTYGHPVGDEVLRTVARHLQDVCRQNDIVGRYGGDEFIVLLPDTGSEGARDFCMRVAQRLGEQHFQTDTGSRLPIEMAFGWAVFPKDAESALDLLTLADSNLYEYKHSGGFGNASREQAAEQSRIEVRKLKNRAAGGSFGVLDALVTAIDNKDRYTRRHSEEVTHYSLLVAREMGYSEEAMRAVRISGLLHDVGKIAVPDEILRHPGNLEAEEWEIMKQHPVFGALIVKDLPHLDEVLDGVRHHHERWDGKGYPDALKETAIPIMGRLLAVGDCFSAMTTNRPYRKAFEPEHALLEIEKGAGIQFDPEIAKTFIRVMRRELAGTGSPQDTVPTISSVEMEQEISRGNVSAAPV